VLWTAIGMAIGSLVLHSALGLRRPFDRTNLSFACIMALVAVFLYLQWQLYGAATVVDAIEIKRRQVTIVNVFFACILVFVPAYSGVRLPRLLAAAFWVGLAIAFVDNLIAPHGLWFSGEPHLAATTFRGEPYTSAIAPPMRAPQIAYTIFFTFFIIAMMACAIKQAMRGERQRGSMLALALAVVLGHGMLDVIRDNVGASWPYVAEYGVVTWGLIMSVQLAYDFRARTQALAGAIAHVEEQTKRLSAMLDALHALEQHMTKPLDTLETGVARLTVGAPADDAQLHRVERAVTRLREFARSMPEINKHGGRRLVGI
jgi:hypothetical protein